MIVLDTNVVSETMKATPHPAVLAWLDGQVANTLYLSCITLAELRFGVGAMPKGRRRDQLNRVLDAVLDLFAGRVLSFDTGAALHYADLAVAARAAGKSFPTPDGYIAAIASSCNFTVATRDVGPFLAAGLQVINPWEIE